MYKFNEKYSPSYDVPLKQPLPCLEYDICLYCKLLLEMISVPFPEYLRDYEECLRYHADRLNQVTPSEFSNELRVYIMDYRLNVLFAALDSDGKIATAFSKYPCNSTIPEDYYYGDGEYIGGSLYPGQRYDTRSMLNFSLKYGFLPIEELSMSTTLVFYGDHLDDRRPLSQFQTQVLMQRYRTKNLVDWNAIVKSISKDFTWLK